MFVKNEAAMKLEDWLIVSDVHIGITKELWKSGFSLPKQSNTLTKKLNKLKKRTRTKRLVILGDLKHKVPGRDRTEDEELVKFIENLDFSEVVVIKGNHDGDIETILKETKAKIKKSMKIGDNYLTHGHRKVNTSCKTIIIGHNHPCISFQDKMKAKYRERAWIIGEMKDKVSVHMKNTKIIWMPAFNELCGGCAINEDKKGLGPVAKSMNIKNANAHLLDGTDLGMIKNLKNDRE